MSRPIFAADVGSRNTRYAFSEGAGCEPTLIAAAPSERRRGELRVTALGRGVRCFAEPCAAPVREGMAADTELLALFLAALAKIKMRRRNLKGTELCCALSGVMPPIRRLAYKKAAEAAGFGGFCEVDASLMGAIGAGLDVFSGSAVMIADIGAQTLRCAVIANGGLLFESMDRFGSDCIDRAIMYYFRREHRALIGARCAEIIKQQLEREEFLIDGRSAEDGLPRSVRCTCAELRECAEAAAKPIVRFIADAFAAVSPEAAADVAENGLVLIGGGARQLGLGSLLERELLLPVRVAENAESAVADGLREAVIGNKKAYERLDASAAAPL